jgi:hypothetical protein
VSSASRGNDRGQTVAEISLNALLSLF